MKIIALCFITTCVVKALPINEEKIKKPFTDIDLTSPIIDSDNGRSKERLRQGDPNNTGQGQNLQNRFGPQSIREWGNNNAQWNQRQNQGNGQYGSWGPSQYGPWDRREQRGPWGQQPYWNYGNRPDSLWGQRENGQGYNPQWGGGPNRGRPNEQWGKDKEQQPTNANGQEYQGNNWPNRGHAGQWPWEYGNRWGTAQTGQGSQNIENGHNDAPPQEIRHDLPVTPSTDH